MKKVVSVLVIAILIGTSLPVSAVDHSLYDRVLEKHVDGGFFDYEEYMKDDDSRSKLNKYLDEMSAVNTKRLDKPEELAFWINLYNAATIRLIEKNFPVSSIKDTGGWITGPWEISFINVGDRTLTLDQIEHEIIRPNFDEPRIHFALVCAAYSCPPLRHEAYVADRLNSQLEEQAEVFLNSDRNRYTIRENRVQLKLSSIFSWYAEDFGGERGVAQYVAQFYGDSVRKPIEEGRYTIMYREYDWSLNQAPGPYNSIEE